LSDEELMAFSTANKPCKVERLASGEILVMTPSGYKNNLREAYVVHELFAWAEADGRGEVFSSNAGFNLPDGSTLSPDAGWVESSRVAALSELERERFLSRFCRRRTLCRSWTPRWSAGLPMASALLGASIHLAERSLSTLQALLRLCFAARSQSKAPFPLRVSGSRWRASGVDPDLGTAKRILRLQ
jgi:hypothetical protein